MWSRAKEGAMIKIVVVVMMVAVVRGDEREPENAESCQSGDQKKEINCRRRNAWGMQCKNRKLFSFRVTWFVDR